MRTSFYSGIAGVALFLPMLASAQTILNLLALANTVLNSLVYLLITGAIVVFFWGLITYLATDGEDKKKGLNRMLMGIAALFVMVSIWGIIQLLQRTFGVTNNRAIVPETIQIR